MLFHCFPPCSDLSVAQTGDLQQIPHNVPEQESVLDLAHTWILSWQEAVTWSDAVKHSQVPQLAHSFGDQPQNYTHKPSQMYLTLWASKSLILSGKPALHCTDTATEISDYGLWQLCCVYTAYLRKSNKSDAAWLLRWHTHGAGKGRGSKCKRARRLF